MMYSQIPCSLLSPRSHIFALPFAHYPIHSINSLFSQYSFLPNFDFHILYRLQYIDLSIFPQSLWISSSRIVSTSITSFLLIPICYGICYIVAQRPFCRCAITYIPTSFLKILASYRSLFPSTFPSIRFSSIFHYLFRIFS